MKKSIVKRVSGMAIATALMLSLLAVPVMAANPGSGDLIGYVNGDTYRNDYFDLQFNLPSGYVFASIPELAEMSGLSTSFYENSGVDTSITWYDLYAEDTSGSGNNLSALVASFSGGMNNVLDKMTLEEYLEDLLPELIAEYESLGLEVYQAAVDRSFYFPAEDYGCCIFEAGVNGESYLFARMVLIKVDNWAYSITATCESESDTVDLLNCFSSIDDFDYQ